MKGWKLSSVKYFKSIIVYVKLAFSHVKYFGMRGLLVVVSQFFSMINESSKVVCIANERILLTRHDVRVIRALGGIEELDRIYYLACI